MEWRRDILHLWHWVSDCAGAAAKQSQGFYWSANYGRLCVLGGSQPSVTHMWQQCDTNDSTWQNMSLWLEADSEFEIWKVAPERTNHVNVWQTTINALKYVIDISSWHLKRKMSRKDRCKLWHFYIQEQQQLTLLKYVFIDHSRIIIF